MTKVEVINNTKCLTDVFTQQQGRKRRNIAVLARADAGVFAASRASSSLPALYSSDTLGGRDPNFNMTLSCFPKGPRKSSAL